MPSMIDISDKFGKVRTVECMGLPITLYPANLQKSDPLGKVHGIVLHWEATDRDDAYDDYHVVICHDPKGKRSCIAKCLDSTQKGQHAWGRNTGLYGIAFAAMAAGYGMTDDQIEAMALTVAEACIFFKLDPRGKVALPKKKRSGQSLVNVGGNVNFPVVMDHAHLAVADGYYPDRWDIGSQSRDPKKNYYNQVMARAIDLYDELKNGKRTPILQNLLK